MNDTVKDKGVLMAILFRFEKYTLPRALTIKQQVENGEQLNDHDIYFLNNALLNIKKYQAIIEDDKEYSNIALQAVWLYNQIISLALKNEAGS
jgi:hypothetical protein